MGFHDVFFGERLHTLNVHRYISMCIYIYIDVYVLYTHLYIYIYIHV